MPPFLILHRSEVRRALERLPATDLVALLTLLVEADPLNAHVHVARDSLSTTLGLSPERTGRCLKRLLLHGFVARIAREGDAEIFDVSATLRRPGAPPPNLPLEPTL